MARGVGPYTPRQAEASLVFLDPSLCFDNLWVDERHQSVGIAATRHIDYEQLRGEIPYLRSSQANTRCVGTWFESYRRSGAGGYRQWSQPARPCDANTASGNSWIGNTAMLCVLHSPCVMFSQTIPHANSLMCIAHFVDRCNAVTSGTAAARQSRRPWSQTLEKSHRINIHTDSRSP